jgi:GNAT superfamily N-acetyltransferase
MNALEFTTDLLVQTGQYRLETHEDRYVQTTPDEPNFWFGNRVIFRTVLDDAKAHLDQFHADLPKARHVCISWDIPGLDRAQMAAMFDETGLTVEEADVLTLTGPLRRSAAPAGVTIRPFQTPSDWHQSEAIAKVHHIEDGLPEAGLDTYLAGHSATRRTLIAQGLGQWFGAFKGDTLVGDMGVFHDQRLIRYQSVQTHKDHRRQGICAALLCACLDWAISRAPDALPVIVANADSDAGRLYRRAGFALAETTISAYRPTE